MTYTYDTDRAPLWRDTDTGEFVADPCSYEPTVPGKLSEAELEAAIADKQRQRDAIAAASQAPRIPRLHRLAGVDLPACAGECQQGRGRCATPGDCLVRRLEPLPQEHSGAGRALIWLLCLSVLLCMGAALLAGVEWADVIGLLAAIGGAL